MDSKPRQTTAFSVFGRDYRYFEAVSMRPRLRLTRNHILMLSGTLVGAVLFSTFIPSEDAEAVRSPAPTASLENRALTLPDTLTIDTLPGQPFSADSIAAPAHESDATARLPDNDIAAAPSILMPEKRWDAIKVKNGDTLAGIAKRAGLSAQDLHQLVNTNEDTKRLGKIFPGDTLEFGYGADNQIRQLRYVLNTTDTLLVTREASGFSAIVEHTPLTKEKRFANGTITSSLFLAAQAAGLSDRLTMELAGIFGWDVDFALDIREGDSFTVVYEEQFKNGKRVADGNIIAAEFVNRGEVYRAILYSPPEGRADYFAPDGRSLRKSFLRSPVEFSRISSKFSLGRKHPILNRIRAHKGVDYAAPTGTPVRATGDGKIVTRDHSGGYGKTVVIQHGSQYGTLYAHLSNYARGLTTGSRVRQGQVIGYVGQTGLATGPHLHYEFRVNGVHRNPLTVKFPDAAPLPQKDLTAFNQFAAPLMAELEGFKSNQVALNDRQ